MITMVNLKVEIFEKGTFANVLVDKYVYSEPALVNKYFPVLNKKNYAETEKYIIKVSPTFECMTNKEVTISL